jgi:hypothetical protein
MANRLINAAGYNRGKDKNDPRRRALGFRGGEAVKELGQYAAKKAVPLYGRYTAIEGGEMSPESLLGNVGVTAFKDKPRRRILHY